MDNLYCFSGKAKLEQVSKGIEEVSKSIEQEY